MSAMRINRDRHASLAKVAKLFFATCQSSTAARRTSAFSAKASVKNHFKSYNFSLCFRVFLDIPRNVAACASVFSAFIHTQKEHRFFGFGTVIVRRLPCDKTSSFFNIVPEEPIFLRTSAECPAHHATPPCPFRSLSRTLDTVISSRPLPRSCFRRPPSS
jgi:hypothetical protein